MSHSTLLNITDAKARNFEKTAAILKFLYLHKFSHQSVLQKLVNVNSRQAIHKSLVHLEMIANLPNQLVFLR